MKTITLLLLFIATTATAQLKSNALYIKKSFPTEYHNKIKRHAVQEWGSDHSMVVYEINKQADALTELVTMFETENTREIQRALIEWSIKGYDKSNAKQLATLTTVDRKSLLTLYCDWSMVLYEYKKQVKAKNAY